MDSKRLTKRVFDRFDKNSIKLNENPLVRRHYKESSRNKHHGRKIFKAKWTFQKMIKEFKCSKWKR